MTHRQNKNLEEASAEFLEMLYIRHRRGALVRSGASAVMWVFALLGYLIQTFNFYQFIGITSSIAFLILINPPTLWILKRIKRLRRYEYGSIMINLLEIFGYTSIIHFVGGIHAGYLVPIYFILIGYTGIVAPLRFPFITATGCAVMYALMVIFEFTGILTMHPAPMREGPQSLAQGWRDYLLLIGAVSMMLYVGAYISAYTAELLRRGREQLRQKNVELEERVKLRTAELMSANENLKREIEVRHLAEETLRESEERYRKLMEANPDPIVVLDVKGNVTYLNPAFTTIFGWTEEEIWGKNIDFFIPDDEFKRNQAMFDKIQSGGSFSGFESKRRTRDGSVIPVSLSGSIYKDKSGNTVGSVVTLRDVREHKRLEEV